MTLTDRAPSPLAGAVFEAIRRKSGWFLALGILLMVLGFIALTFTLFTTLVSVMMLGWLMIFSGALHVLHATQARDWKGFGLHILVGLLDAFIGVWFVIHPGPVAAVITIFLGAFFMASGLLQIIASAARHVPNRFWAIISGVINFVLGICIWVQWPGSSLWFIGTFIGIALIFRGWMWISVAMAARNIAAAHPTMAPPATPAA
jgi:uncharacterized membrane protein HdeD (DUF308 family)